VTTWAGLGGSAIRLGNSRTAFLPSKRRLLFALRSNEVLFGQCSSHCLAPLCGMHLTGSRYTNTLPRRGRERERVRVLTLVRYPLSMQYPCTSRSDIKELVNVSRTKQQG
jgi:hypothetical protein